MGPFDVCTENSTQVDQLKTVMGCPLILRDSTKRLYANLRTLNGPPQFYEQADVTYVSFLMFTSNLTE